uniref:PIH1 N-terminal domain-containing protein n=1 Tax=Terrapene triunguis TaxID=2587831 RepID=A0A674IZP9_9SAUR
MASQTDKSLLSAELEEEDDEEFRQLLLQVCEDHGVGVVGSSACLIPLSLQATQKIQSAMPSVRDSKPIQPQPGFCIKTHAGSQEKVFVNICRSLHIPAPPDLSCQELECLIESDSASSFRIPMSLGEPHAELDNSGNGCTAYDVVINSGFFSKVEVCAPWWRILKNRKFMGSISGQTIRTKSSPVIQEMDFRPQAWACPLWETSQSPMGLCRPQTDSGGWVHGRALGQRGMGGGRQGFLLGAEIPSPHSSLPLLGPPSLPCSSSPMGHWLLCRVGQGAQTWPPLTTCPPHPHFFPQLPCAPQIHHPGRAGGRAP